MATTEDKSEHRVTNEQNLYGSETHPEDSATDFWAAARSLRAKLLSRLKSDRESVLVSPEEEERRVGGPMSAIDQLLIFLLEGKSRVAQEMMSVGFSEDEMRDAWDQARAAGFTESTGLGQDRLTEKGRARAKLFS